MLSRETLLQLSEEAALASIRTLDLGNGPKDLGAMAYSQTHAINALRLAVLAAIAEPEPQHMMINAAPPPPFATWGYLELMGHRTIVGYIEEDDLVGRRVLRVRELKRADRKPGVGEPDPPLELDERWRIYSPSAVYGFEPIATEQEARARYLNSYQTDAIPF